MKIVFDHQAFCTQRYGGFTKYFYHLAISLNELDDVCAKVIAPAYINGYLESSVLGKGSFPMRRLARGLNQRVHCAAPLFRWATTLQRPDIVHETHYILGGAHVPAGPAKIATCHDMIEEKGLYQHPNLERASRLKKLSYERADRIICISQCTYRDLTDIYPEFASRAVVVHHGVEKTTAVPNPNGKIPASYLLYVGVRTGYKNFESLVRAYAISPRLRSEFDLVCFGGGEFSPEERQMLVDAGLIEGRVHVLAGNDKFLAHVYAHAAALVYPSLYEGFGMPLLEAMVQGCPVVASQTGSLPEVGGEAAAYFDPAQPEDIALAIERVVFDDGRRNSMTEAGMVRAPSFSWEKCAKSTLAAYRSVVRSSTASSPLHNVQR